MTRLYREPSRYASLVSSIRPFISFIPVGDALRAEGTEGVGRGKKRKRRDSTGPDGRDERKQAGNSLYTPLTSALLSSARTVPIPFTLAALNLHLTKGIVHEGFNHPW